MAENKIPLLTREHQQGPKEEANRFAVVHAKPHDKRIRLHYTTTMEETQVKDYYTCPHCGANLDHGERCDCEKCIDRDAPKPRKRPQPYMGGYNYQRKDGTAMTLLARKINARCVCPTCETEWEQNSDGTWWCDPDWGRIGYDSWHKDPTEGGRLYCPVCAANTATAADHLRFITQEQLHRAFLDWLIDSDEEAVTCFRALLFPDPEWLEQRMAEFIQDRQEQEFVEWRCG